MPGLIGKKILLCGFNGSPKIEINEEQIKEVFNVDCIKPITLEHLNLHPMGFRDYMHQDIKPLSIEFELTEQQRIDISNLTKDLRFEYKKQLDLLKKVNEDLYRQFVSPSKDYISYNKDAYKIK